MRLERFAPQHFHRMQLQPAQAYVRECTSDAHLDRLAKGGAAYAVLEGEEVILCGGACQIGADEVALWAFVSPAAGARMLRLSRYAARLIQTLNAGRIVATCQTGFAPGARWLAMLGLRRECHLGPFGPAGVPHDLWVRV